MRYRKEIDGLRAIAVLPVILFHADISGFSGGYIGVDVFFVISGYLITSIILEEKCQNRFSIIAFYERRARRILPALSFVLVFTTIAAYVSLPAHSLKAYSQSLVSVSSFSSNLYFSAAQQFFCNFRVGCGTGSSSLGSRVQKAVAREPLAVNLSKATSRSIKMRGRSSLHYSQRAIQRPHLLLQEKRPCQKPSEPRSRAAPYREPSLI